MRKDESRLINTLARESERISTKENFFSLSNVKDHLDLNVSGWNDNKNLPLGSLSALPPVHLNSSTLRQTKIENFSKVKFDRLSDSQIRMKILYSSGSRILMFL